MNKFQHQLETICLFSEIFNKYKIDYWLGGGIAWELCKGSFEKPRPHGDIDFHIFEDTASTIINNNNIINDFKNKNWVVFKPEKMLIGYQKISFRNFSSRYHYEVEMPVIIENYFKANKNGKLKKYFCKADYFKNNLFEYNNKKIRIVNKSYVVNLYNKDGRRK